MPPAALRLPSPPLLLFLFLFLLPLLLPSARAHVPVPDSVLAPRTAPEAWNVLRLATDNLTRLLHENRLAEITDQLSLLGPSLRALPPLSPPDQHRSVAEQSVRAQVAVGSMAQAAAAGDRPLTDSSFAILRAALDKMSAAFDPKTVHADIFYCPMHPDVLGPDPAALCAKCGMSLVPRHIPYSFIYVPPGEPSLLLTATPDAPLSANQPAHVTIHLRKRDNSPVLLTDLTVTHTQPIHLLIVDAALSDYHHEHPVPTDTPGEYAFTFTPARSTAYRIFADVVPVASGVQEYPFADLPGSAAPTPPPLATHRENTFTSTAAGLTFHLTLEDAALSPLRAGQPRNLRITAEDADRHPVTNLEPFMAAFAHLVGFYDDYRTVVHLHPAGGEITNPALRGGPTLDFKLYPPKSGLLRLYLQVQRNGQPVYAPFDLHVEP